MASALANTPSIIDARTSLSTGEKSATGEHKQRKKWLWANWATKQSALLDWWIAHLNRQKRGHVNDQIPCRPKKRNRFQRYAPTP